MRIWGLTRAMQVAYGYSRFCELFTYEEWIGFSYSVDLFFSGVSGFQSKTGVSSTADPLPLPRPHDLHGAGCIEIQSR